MSKPFYAHVYVTRSCNLRCKMCNVWTYGSKDKEWNIDDLLKVRDVLKSLGVAFVVLTGGEPFLRDDLPEIVRIFSSAGFLVRIQTNGSWVVSETRLKSVADAGLDFINFSLDTCDPAKHDYICRSEGVWHYVVNNIEKAVKILPKDRAVNVAITVSALNIKELPDLVSFVDSMDAYSLPVPVMLPKSNNITTPYRAFSDEMSFDRVDKTIVKNVFSTLFLLKKRGVKIGMSDVFLRAAEDVILSGEAKWECDAGLLYFAIYPGGFISPCSEINPVSNILSEDFLTLFRSEAYRIQVKHLRENCEGCIHGCWREVSYLIHKNSVLRERTMSYIPNLILQDRK